MIARRRADSEEGFALVMALVAVAVIAITFAAVLNQTGTLAKSQEVLQEKRAKDLAADGAIDMAILRLQTEQGLGKIGDDAGCNDYENPSELAPDDPYVDPDVGSVKIMCTPDEYSGIDDTHATGLPAENVLLALGGVWGIGRREVTSPNVPGDDNVPFCDNYVNGTQGACELGVFVYKGNTQQETVIVKSNGSASGKPLIASNGSVAADSAASPPRFLQVSGSADTLVSARRGCVNVIPTDKVSCGTVDKPKLANALNTDFFTTPPWKHDLWSGLTASAQQTPGLKRWYNWDSNDSHSGTTVTSSASKTTVKDLCDDGYMEFQPGTYVDLQPLNYLMTNCPQTTYYFYPGHYYFDFTDVGDDTWSGTAFAEYWHEPLNFGQIVGGTVDLPDGTQTLKPCVPAGCAATTQPTKTMRPDQLDEEYKQGSLTSIENGNEIDTSWSSVALSSNTSTNDDEMLGTQGIGSASSSRVLRTPLLSKDSVNSVILRISETHEAADVSCYTGNLPQDDPGYDPLHPPPLCDPWAAGYPQLQVALNGVNSSMCYIDLDTTPTKASGVLPIGVVYKDYELTNGCPGTVDANSTFPKNSSVNNKWDPTKVNSVVYNVFYKRSKWLQANQNPNVEPNKSAKSFHPKPSAGLNGLELQVGYTGPPAPQYPGGCNAAAGRDKGVQFVFGNLSRMAFLEHDSWVELCGLATDDDKHSIAMWGLGGPQCNDVTLHTPCQTTVTDTPDPLEASSTGQSHKVDSSTRLLTDYDVASNVTTSAVTGFTNLGNATALKADDTSFAYTNPAWTSTTHATFSVKMPSNFVPDGSVIEHVRLKLQHAEPKITASDSAVTNITLSVTPGSVSPDTSDVGGDNTASTFGAHAVTPRLTTRTYDSTNAATPASDYATKCTALPLDCWRTYDSDSDALTAADLTVAMRTPKGLNNAVITLDAYSNDASATKHQMFVNGLELIVDYRPPGVLRPLAGCMTIRTLANRYTQSASTPGDGAPSNYRGTAYDHNGAFGSGNYIQTNNDKAAQTNQGIMNSNACSWIAFGSHSSNDQQGAKLHIAGDVFAPTVSLDLAGKSNETSFVTDGVVARQITARRWVSTSQLSAFGNNPTFTHNPRIMYLTASIDGVDIARAEVHIDDSTSTTTISSWKRLS